MQINLDILVFFLQKISEILVNNSHFDYIFDHIAALVTGETPKYISIKSIFISSDVFLNSEFNVGQSFITYQLLDIYSINPHSQPDMPL